jgi:hypothetical protein
MSLSSSSFKCVALLAAVLVPVALTGCANMVTTSTATTTPAATVSGTLHGGQQPVSGATVTLYAAGTTGYGSLPTLFATTTTSTDGGGSFGFTQMASSPSVPTGIINSAANVYSCPTTGNPQMYLVAKGGSTEGPASPLNSAAAFIIALGPCSTSGSYVTMNEVTTVATLAALQQYFNPAIEGFGYNSTAQSALGFANGVATISSLVIPSGGGVGANTTFTPISTYNSSVVTGTPESAKINSIANILAACVNTTSNTSAGCTTLFTNAVPPASAAATSQPTMVFPATTDTLQAAYYMLINPTDGGTTALGNLFTNANYIGAPFQPVLTTAPTDWTIGIGYSSASSGPAVSGNTPALLNFTMSLAADASGNIWVLNEDTGSLTGKLFLNNVTELSPTGGIINNILAGSNLRGPQVLIIDPSGNLWTPNYGTSTSPGTTVVEYTTNGTINTFTTKAGPKALASDGQGNIFVLEPFFGTGGEAGDLEEIPAGSATGTTATTLATGLATDFSNLAVDSNYTIWVTGGSTASPGAPQVEQFLYNSATNPHYSATPNVTSVGGQTNPDTALAIDNSNNVWVVNDGTAAAAGPPAVAAVPSTLSEILASTSSTFTGAGPFGGLASTIILPEVAVADGASNIWFTNFGASAAGNVIQYSDTGTLLSPSAGYAHTYNEPIGMAIDPSGNVWIADNNTSSAKGSATSPQITEIVGAAVPVVTPLAAGLPTTPGGTNKLGSKP